MRRPLRLLWITPNLPRRGVSAARAHWWSLIARLARRHEITLLAFVDPEDVGVEIELPPGLAAVHRVPKGPWRPYDPMALLPRSVAGGFSNPVLARAVAEQVGAGKYDLVQYEYTEMANLMAPPVAPTILTVHQIGFADEGPMWRVQGRGFRRGAIFLHRYLRELDFELCALRRAHHVITVSAEDAKRLRRFHPDLPVSVSPVGIDCEYFRPTAEVERAEVELLFVGNFAHPPNPDAVRFLVGDILPRLGSSVRLRVVGQGVTPEISALARSGSIEVVGAVDDLRPHLSAAKIFVAPVRFGTGMRGKVLEALAMGRPIVTTSVGAEGLHALSGRHLLVADGPEEFTAAVRRVLADPAFGRHLGNEGRALAESRFAWDRVAAGHDEIYAHVLEDPGPTPKWSSDPAGRWAPAAERLGRWPAIGVGMAVLLARGLGWQVRRLRRARALRVARALEASEGKTLG